LLQNHFIDGLAIISVLVHIISRDAPCYYLTSVAKDRLPVFRSDSLKHIACAALNEARRSGKFALYAYVIKPDQLHILTHQNPVRPAW
jgi:REP element-mobilizing transposase RayT